MLAEDQDRLARDQEDIAAIYKRVTFGGAKIVTLPCGEINELHIGLKGTMDALEFKKMAEKIRRGQRGAVARGRVPGGLCYGYALVRELDDRGELKRGLRRVDPAQAAVALAIGKPRKGAASTVVLVAEEGLDKLDMPLNCLCFYSPSQTYTTIYTTANRQTPQIKHELRTSTFRRAFDM